MEVVGAGGGAGVGVGAGVWCWCKFTVSPTFELLDPILGDTAVSEAPLLKELNTLLISQ